MGLERASTIGGDGVGVSGFATISEQVNNAALAPAQFTQPLLVKNMPSLRVVFLPILNPAGSLGTVQIGIRGGNGAGIIRWHTIQTVGIGGIAPVVVELKFPADFLRAGYAPGAAVVTQMDILLGCSI